MKFSIGLIASGMAASIAFATPVQAQDGIDEQVEQGLIEDGAKIIGDLGKAAGCEAVKKIPFIGGRIARELGCDKRDEEEPTPGPTNISPGALPDGGNTGTIPAGEAMPSLTVSLVKLTGTGNAIEAKASDPDTVYEAGSGFAMVVQNTAPGYLEVWSVDDEAAFIEGALLPNAGALVLPASVQGLYRLDDNTAEEYIRFRFYPCTPQGEQSFDLEENQQAAKVTGNAAKAIARLSERLDVCSFDTAQIEAAIEAKEPQDNLFRTAINKAARFDKDKSAYVIESNKVRPMDALIELKRK